MIFLSFYAKIHTAEKDFGMEITQIKCIKCGSTKAVKNGVVGGWQRYKCKKCGYQYTKQSPHGLPIVTQVLASSLYTFGLSKRTIAKLVGVTPTTVVRWIKKFHIYYMSSIAPNEKREIMSQKQVQKMIANSPSNQIIVIQRTLPSGGRIDLLIHRPKNL